MIPETVGKNMEGQWLRDSTPHDIRNVQQQQQQQKITGQKPGFHDTRKSRLNSRSDFTRHVNTMAYAIRIRE